MKKTLITLLAMTGVAMADYAHFDTLVGVTTQNGITNTNGVLTGDSLTSKHNVVHSNGSNDDFATSVVCITLNLTAMQNATVASNSYVELFYFDAKFDTGLALTSSGIKGLWETSTNGDVGAGMWNSNSNTAYALTTLTTNPYAYQQGENTYLDLAVVVGSNYGNGWQGIGGLVAYDAAGNKVIEYNGLTSAGNADQPINSIKLNTDFITSATVYQGDVPVITGGVGSWLVSQGIIPEPATATLSLLALSALATRRRRK